MNHLNHTTRFIGLLSLCLLASSCKPGGKEKQEAPKPVDNTPVVKTTPLFSIKKAPIVETIGVAQAVHQSKLSSEVSGKVLEISPNFQAGKTLKKGEVILKLESTNYQAALANAELDFSQEQALSEQAKEELSIVGDLDGASELALRIPQLKRAQINLAKAKSDLAKCTITAPYDCEVISKNVSLGENLTPSQLIGEVFSNNDIEIKCGVSESEFKLLDHGNILLTKYFIRSEKPDADEYSFSTIGTIDRASSILDPKTLTYSLYVKAKHSVKVGSYPKVKFQACAQYLKSHAASKHAIFNNKLIGVNSEDSTIKLYDVKIISYDDTQIYFNFVSDDKPTHVIASKLPIIVDGMEVRIIE